ncbi:MAG: M15 family metallopeptidase [Elusimicrobia bacterium]|nr:M15 family metallopeptidase [Elusimicrobiota bacterium]
MRYFALFLVLCGCVSLGEPLVRIQNVSPNVDLDIRYATDNNFTGKKVYPAAVCGLRKSVADRLAAVAREFEAMGYQLKVYDCYRPLSVQKRFWALVPDERYVANPAKGSRHNRGAAVDVTLVDKSGKELEMPSAYDDFSEKAHRDYTGATPMALRNKEILEKVMIHHGFVGLPTEWWHFDAQGWEKYPIEDIPLEDIR